MVTRIAALAAAALLWLAPAAAWAQQHGEEHDPPEAAAHGEGHEAAHGEGHGAPHAYHAEDITGHVEFWAAIVNFLLLVAVIYLLARKPLAGFLTNRRRGIEEGLEEAQRMHEEAEKKYDEYSRRLEKLDEEMERIREEMIKAGEAERDRIVSDAEASAARMRRETEFLIEQQMKQLRVDMTREAVEAAIAAAEGVLRDQTSGSDQQRLAEEYLERLAEHARKGTGGATTGGQA